MAKSISEAVLIRDGENVLACGIVDHTLMNACCVMAAAKSFAKRREQASVFDDFLFGAATTCIKLFNQA